MSKNDIWMPLNVGDYLADTGHLSTAEHGAYLLLLMHYWRKKGLPDDDRQLAAIAKLQLRIWLTIKPTMQAFFYDGWRHKRVDAELQRRADVSEKRSAAGFKGGSSKKANASFCSSMTQLQKQKEDRIVDARARASGFTDGSKALATSLWKALGYESALSIPPEIAGADWRAIEWEKAGWTPDLIDIEARRVGPGKPLIYYEKCFATSFAKRQAPLPVVDVREAEKLTVTKNAPKDSPFDAAYHSVLDKLNAGLGGPAPEERLRVGEGEADARLLAYRRRE